MKNFFKVQRKFKGGIKVKTLKVKSISIMLVFTLLMTVFMPITASARTVAPATNDGERDMAISSDGVITWERLSIDDTCEEIYGNPVIYKLTIVSGDGDHVLEEIPNLTSTSYNLIEHMDAQRYYTNRFSFRVTTTNYSTPGGGIPVYYYVSPYQKLDAPTNLRWDGNTARWNAAQNAVNYHISLYNTIGELVEGHNTNNLYYTPSSTPLDGWYFEVYSKATGDYFDSNNSESPKKGSLGTRTVAPATNDGERDMAISSDGVITWERLGIDDTCEEIYGNPVIYKLVIVSGDGDHVLEEIPNLTSTSYNLIEHMDAQRYYTNRFSFRVTTTNYSTPGGGIPVYYYVSPYQKLDAPTNLRWDGNTARWNAAQNAVNYHISLYNTIGEYVEGRNTNNLYYTPSSTPLDGWYFEVYSKATGDYFDSNENESPKKGANNVTFDLNGGTWTDAGTNPQVVNDGETAIRPTNPTKSGHVFAGWYADSACTTPFSFLTAITSNKTIYAKWDIITNSVNAILSPTPSVGLTIGDLVLTSGDSSKYSVSAGYWKLNDSGSALDKSSTQFEAGQTYTLYLTYYPENGYNIPDDATYTVNGIPTEWSGFEAESNRKISFTIPAVTTYTVTYDANGGTGSMADATGVSGDYVLPVCGFTAPDGKQFKAWAIGSVNGVQKQPDEQITITGETYIYAIWKELPTAEVTHSFGAYVYNNDATESADGTKTRTCSVCGHKETIVAEGTKLQKKIIDSSKVFTDVPAKKWFKTYVDYAVTYGIFTGTSKTTFSPDSNITRAQFVQVLANLSGVDTSNRNVKTSFSDVPSGKWYTAAVKWASDNKIVNGMGAGIFAPDANVTREQMCLMLTNYAKFKGVTLKAVEPKENFADDASISGWAKDAVYVCQQADIVNGKGAGMFDPKGTGTRAEASVIFTKFHQGYMK